MGPLIAVLSDPDEAVRDDAAAALGAIGAPAVAPLVIALKGRYDDPRRVGAAREALGAIGGPAVEPLIAALRDPDNTVRQVAAETLSQIDDARVVEPLIAALRDEDREVRKAAARALDGLAWSPDGGQAGAAYWAVKGEWAKCVQIGAPAVEPLIIALKDRYKDTDKIDAAAAALVRIGAPAVEPLVAVLGDEDLHVRMAAAKALDKLAWSPDGGQAGAAYWAVKGKWAKCVEIGAPALEPLLATLNDESGLVRKPAAEGLLAIYRSGRLDEAQKARLLAQRGVITQGHDDYATECGSHVDKGIGVEFPV